MQAIHQQLREIHMIGGRSREWRLAVQACPPLRSAGIYWTGWTHAVSGYRFVRHHPFFAGLILCQSGRGLVFLQDRWQECGPNQAYLLPRGTLHAYRAIARGTWNICWVAMHPDSYPALASGNPRLVTADSRPLFSAVEGLQREINGPADRSATQLWVDLIRLYTLRIIGPLRDDHHLGALWEKVDADLAHPWSLDDLAGLLSLSPEHFRRLTHAQMHCSPMQYVTRLRIRRAAALLVSTSQKVAAIAHAVGYDNPFAFSTTFTRHLGLSPATYRANLSAQDQTAQSQL